MSEVSSFPSTRILGTWNHGVADGTRTHDNRNHNPGLYQLSYSHHCLQNVAPCNSDTLACPAGLEPTTAGLEGRCSIRLSYGQIAPNDIRVGHALTGRGGEI
jgi:hypothetical protein